MPAPAPPAAACSETDRYASRAIRRRSSLPIEPEDAARPQPHMRPQRFPHQRLGAMHPSGRPRTRACARGHRHRPAALTVACHLAARRPWWQGVGCGGRGRREDSRSPPGLQVEAVSMRERLQSQVGRPRAATGDRAPRTPRHARGNASTAYAYRNAPRTAATRRNPPVRCMCLGSREAQWSNRGASRASRASRAQ